MVTNFAHLAFSVRVTVVVVVVFNLLTVLLNLSKHLTRVSAADPEVQLKVGPL